MPLRVAIVGAGFSGAMVAIHLLRQEASVAIDLIDERLPGRGLAYSTPFDDHLLNVPAIRMSAFGSEPMHFLHWLHAHGSPGAVAETFAPRKLYGTYVQDTFEETLRSARGRSHLEHHFAQVTSAQSNGLGVSLRLDNGEQLETDKVVLALGNPPPPSLAQDLPGSFASPWDPGALAHLRGEESVLLVGSGLTAVDALLALLAQGHTGRIYMLSRRGQLPQVHASYRPLPDAFTAPLHPTARTLLSLIRKRVAAAHTEGVDWRAVIDSLRPVTNDIWLQLPSAEQYRVFRHLKTWWDIHRHRMAPQIGATVAAALERKQLVVQAGRLSRLEAGGAGVTAHIRLRQGGASSLSVERVINCTGPNANYERTQNALVRSLLDAGIACVGATGKGLHATAAGELLTASHQPVDWLLTLGPPRLGDLFETTAVPELRRQAEALANHLLAIATEPLEVLPEMFIAAGI